MRSGVFLCVSRYPDEFDILSTIFGLEKAKPPKR